MTPRRICFVTTFYPPASFGGDGIAIQRFAQALSRRGHEVTVVHDADAFTVLGGRTPTDGLPDPFGVRVISLRSRLPMLSTLLTQQTGRPIVNARRLRETLDGGRFDVIVFNNVSLVGGPGILAYGGGAAKIYLAHEHWLVCPSHVLWRHNREPCVSRECLRCQLHYRRPPQLWRHTGLLDRALSHIHTFVAMSEFSRDKHREYGFPRDMTVLPYFIQESDHTGTAGPSPHGRPYFLFVGRLERLKGLDDVIDAFGRYDGADLLIVGDGTHGDALRARAAGNPRVVFAGRVPNDRLTPYYRHSLALLAPSIGFETFGITLIEGFSHGTPVIARRRGPYPEIIEQAGGGLLFGSPDELIEALRTLEVDAAGRAALGKAGCEAFRTRWSEAAVMPQFIRMMEDTLGKRQEASRARARD